MTIDCPPPHITSLINLSFLALPLQYMTPPHPLHPSLIQHPLPRPSSFETLKPSRSNVQHKSTPSVILLKLLYLKGRFCEKK